MLIFERKYRRQSGAEGVTKRYAPISSGKQELNFIPVAVASKRKEYICAYPVQCLNGTGLYLSKQTYPAGITKFLLHILLGM